MPTIQALGSPPEEERILFDGEDIGPELPMQFLPDDEDLLSD